MTDSSRLITSLSTPESLDVSKIWENWLPKYISEGIYTDLDKNTSFQFSLKLLLTIAASIPRAVQHIITEVETSLKSSAVISFEQMESFYAVAFNKLLHQYASIESLTVTTEHMHAILYQENVKLNNASWTSMITKSFLINSLGNIHPDFTITPKTCLLSLKIYMNKYGLKELYWKCIGDVITELEVLYFPDPTKIVLGKFLETALKGIIEARIYVSKYISNKSGRKSTVTITQLLQINELLWDRNSNLRILDQKFVVPYLFSRLRKFELPDSHKNASKFLSHANSTYSDDDDILVLVPDGSECFDYGLLLYTAEDSVPFAVFIDAKSGDPSKVPKQQFKNSCTMEGLPAKGQQAQYLINIANKTRNSNETNVNKRSMLNALRQGSYVYVYIKSTIGAPSYAVGDHVIQLGQQDTTNLLSFFVDSYRLVRNLAANQMYLPPSQKKGEGKKKRKGKEEK